MDVEDNLSLILGKNNTGKTSLLSVLERFLLNDNNVFTFDDFNVKFRSHFKTIFNKYDEFPTYSEFGISLELFINYYKDDDLSNISSLILNLDPKENILILKYVYSITFEGLKRLKSDYSAYKEIYNDKDFPDRDILFFLSKTHKDYFKIRILSVESSNANIIKEIEDKKIIKKIINFQKISAKRDVANVEGDKKKSEKTLSGLSARYYEQRKIFAKEEEESLGKQLSETDKNLCKIYAKIFSVVLSKVKKFGGIKENDSIISIISTLEGKNILNNNTTVAYQFEGNLLPEEYNGLGYMNLINIIFEIECAIDRFKHITMDNPAVADINLLLIEEPEAHTHPQMQYVFSHNIKECLKESTQDSEGNTIINMQTIITTHSPHIATKSDFKDYKYFYRNGCRVISKNISELEKLYDQDKQAYNFIRQYITLNRAEMFFADKVIMIEGDTERLLLSAMMKKMDNLIQDERGKLLSQNISIIEVGNYSHVFEKLIDFLGIKTLVITDLDTSIEEVAVNEKGEVIYNKDGTEKKTSRPCRVKDANVTKNSALNYFYSNLDLNTILSLDFKKSCY